MTKKRLYLAKIAGGIIFILCLIAILSAFGFPFTTYTFDQTSEHILEAPSVQHLFGTDELGRDLLTRVILWFTPFYKYWIPYSFYSFHSRHYIRCDQWIYWWTNRRYNDARNRSILRFTQIY